jgi:hypothetical protein
MPRDDGSFSWFDVRDVLEQEGRGELVARIDWGARYVLEREPGLTEAERAELQAAAARVMASPA